MLTIRQAVVAQKSELAMSRPKKPAFTLGTVKLVRAKSGTRYLVVRVNSKKKKAVIRVRLTGKSARLLKAKTITIRTNHLVKISTKTLRVPKATKKANVRVLRVR